MRTRTLLAATAVIVVTAAAAAAFGLLRPEGAVGADQPASTVVGTLAIEGLTPPDQPIKVLAYSWGLSDSVTCLPGGCSGGKVNVQDLSLTRFMDTLSPRIVRALATGEHFESATLLVNASGVGNAPTHRFEFEPVIFTSESLGGSGGSRQTENLTFTFTKFTFENVS
jgi:type VI secretion system secreted protein Hcp